MFELDSLQQKIYPGVKYGMAAREAYDSDLGEEVLNVMPDIVIIAGSMHTSYVVLDAPPKRI